MLLSLWKICGLPWPGPIRKYIGQENNRYESEGVLVVSSDHQDWKNKLYFGDNLNVLREHVQDETADLIYLDPQPFRMDRYCDCQARFNPSLLKRETTKVLV